MSGVSLARALWAGGVESARSPAVRYLIRRGVWPGRDVGRFWPSLPGAVRWASRGALERAGLLGFADDAHGAALLGYAPVDSFDVQAVTITVLTAEGRAPASGPWRAIRGNGAFGAVCRMTGNLHGRDVALVGGELDAVAVAFAARYSLLGLGDVAEVRAVGSVGGFVPSRAAYALGRSVVLLPDSGTVDRAEDCAARLRGRGRPARVDLRGAGAAGVGPAADLAGLVQARAAQFDEEGADVDGEREAWRALMGLSGTGRRAVSAR